MEDPDQLLLGGVLAGGVDGEEVLTEVHAPALVGVKQPEHHRVTQFSSSHYMHVKDLYNCLLYADW